MAKVHPIPEVVEEISKSISASLRKERRIRSGRFWNKFGFARRTRERIDAVKAALNDQGIAINLEDSAFGTESRSYQIVFSRAESVPRKSSKNSKAKSLPTNLDEQIEVQGAPAFENFHKYDDLEARLRRLNVEVLQSKYEITYTFSVLFVEAFRNDAPSYEVLPGVFGATRSNWTYHTANAISQTCRMLNLTCKFEALGKRDAIIETIDSSPEIILAAEWEWNCDDIFAKGKELDKLMTTCKQNPTSDAFLFTYCLPKEYPDYLERIAEYWIRETAKFKQAPTLFLHTVIFVYVKMKRQFKVLKTVMIHPKGINVWADRNL